MKTLLIAPFYENGSFCKISECLINSFNQIEDIELFFRPIFYEQDYQSLSNLKRIDFNKLDVVIQYCLPADYVSYPQKRNIFYCNKYYPNIILYKDFIDEIWVPSDFLKNKLLLLGFKNVLTIPYSTDNAKFAQKYISSDIEQRKNGDFLFYNISHKFSRKKNYLSLLKAFHSEFSPEEPVNLVVKFCKDEDRMATKNFFNNLKRGLNIYKNIDYYKEEILLSNNYISDQDIDSIHNTCDCFVSTSFEESLCIPSYDSVGFGKTPIVCGYGGRCEEVNNETGNIIDYNLEPIYAEEGRTAKENWGSINIRDLRSAMRKIYQDEFFRKDKFLKGINRMMNFSLDKTKNAIIKALYNDKEI